MTNNVSIYKLLKLNNIIFFIYVLAKFWAYISITLAPLHPNAILLFKFNKLVRVQVRCKLGASGCKLGADFNPQKQLAPKINLIISMS